MVLRTLVGVFGMCCCAAGFAQAAGSDFTEHEFVVKDFRLESGTVLPHARIRYVTTGTRDQRAENVVLVPSWYTGTIEDNLYLVDADAGIDRAKYFVVFTELFGSGKSSSPSNTPAPFDGPRFPVTTIRDNVRICHQLLFGKLQVRRLRSVVGFSMGAQQAFQWAVSYPDQVESIVPVCGTAKTYHHGVVRLESAISCLQADANWNNGDLLGPLEKGAEAWARHWAAWVYSQEWWRKELYRDNGHASPQDVIKFFVARFDSSKANDVVLQARTWQRHDVGGTQGFGGDVVAALRSIRARVLYMPGETDLYFPMTDARYEKQYLKRVVWKPMPSLWGHAAGAGWGDADKQFILKSVRAFLSQ